MKVIRILTFVFIYLLLYATGISQDLTDSVVSNTDSIQIADSISITKKQINSLDHYLQKNKFINTASPVFLTSEERNKTGKEFLFYLLSTIILLLAFFKVFYAKYFNNIFRVFFNSSLRQNQLTDLLLQAKLPSLIFNTFFVISAGLYAWLLMKHYHLLKESNNYVWIGLSILFIAVIYFGKFISLKFIGWISGMTPAIDQYIFVIFLINKIIGIVLLPFIVLLAFAPASWIIFIIITSFCILGILFLLRYLRSYGLLQNQLKINGFHFLLYIFGMEVLPILLIYKIVNTMFLKA